MNTQDEDAIYRLTTAEIIYRTPEESEEQVLVWQDFDHMPDFPRLKRFLEHWQEAGTGELHSVTVTHIAASPEPAYRFSSLSDTVH